MIIFLRLIWKYNHKILKFIFAVKRNAKRKEYHFISSLNCTVCESFPSFCHVVLYSFNFSTLFIYFYFFRFIFFLYSSTQLVFAFNYLSIHFFRWYHFSVLFFRSFLQNCTHALTKNMYIYSVALQIHSKHARLQALSL
jgi:hypothetical protein